MVRAFVIGQSHTSCITQAQKDDPALMPDIVVLRLRGSKGSPADGVTIEQAFEEVACCQADPPVFLSILGTFHNIYGLLKHDIPFDFLWDKGDALNQLEAQLVPTRAMKQLFESKLENAFGLTRLQESTKGKVYLLSSPPPKQSTEFMMRFVEKRPEKIYHGRRMLDCGFNPPELRQKLWRLECSINQEWAEKRGMTFVPPPPAAFDEDGFLAIELYASDVTHANASFGKLVLNQIQHILETTDEACPHD